MDRRCTRHPNVVISSPDGMFDAPCGACEYESDMGEREATAADYFGACNPSGDDIPGHFRGEFVGESTQEPGEDIPF